MNTRPAGRLLRWAVLTAAVSCALDWQAGCATPTTRGAAELTARTDWPPPDNRFAPGQAILTGFDEPQPGAELRVGDAILYGIDLARADREQIWYARLQVLLTQLQPGTRIAVVPGPDSADAPPPPGAAHTIRGPHPAGGSDTLWLEAPRLPAELVTLASNNGVEIPGATALLRIEVFDEQARLQATVYPFAFESLLEAGLYETCRIAGGRHAAEEAELTPAERAQVIRSIASLFSYGDLLMSTPHVNAIIHEIIAWPSLLSIIMNLGIRPTFAVALGEATPALSLPWLPHVPAGFRVPLRVKINREPALECVLTVVDPAPPLRLCAGIAGIDGVHVRDDTHQLQVRLLAARRGPEPAGAPTAAAQAHADAGGAADK